MKSLNNLVLQYKEEYIKDLESVKDESDLENLRIKHLSRQGKLAILVGNIKDLSSEEKKIAGPLFNQLKTDIQNLFQYKKDLIEKENQRTKEYAQLNFDVTASKPNISFGSLHPYTHIVEKIEDIFITMGFEIAEGPEVETEFHNFDALNIPANHPARDIQDTFWLKIPNMLMRTHTSTVQVHKMLKQKPPIAVIAPGRAYRNEATDASHDFMFMQLEGLLVNKNISLSNLFATLKNFLQVFFEKKELNIRIRPSYFPFVEPGLEVDMTCPFCATGCSVCKKTKWIEIGGAGLVHPNVFSTCNIDPKVYSGFAFGLGLTRLVMLKYGITDIRLLHSNRVDFLKQF